MTQTRIIAALAAGAVVALGILLGSVTNAAIAGGVMLFAWGLVETRPQARRGGGR